jgi:adenine-specific DNA-methyltransferase
MAAIAKRSTPHASRESQLKSLQKLLGTFQKGSIIQAAQRLFEELGYPTARRIHMEEPTADLFEETFVSAKPTSGFRTKEARLEEWTEVDLAFQLAEPDIREALKVDSTQLGLHFGTEEPVDQNNERSYLVLAINLLRPEYSRAELVAITREVNRLFPMPVLVVMRYGDRFSLAVIHRRRNKKDDEKSVLEKVSIIKDINLASPNRAHLEILHDLRIDVLKDRFPSLHDFRDLTRAWQQTLDIQALNNRFYRELRNWYFWATHEIELPEGSEPDRDKRNSIGVIRLITRVIFVWFLKEKRYQNGDNEHRLVPMDLFDYEYIRKLVKLDADPQESGYYRAILQNLFFATLSSPMEKDEPGSRQFKPTTFQGKDKERGSKSFYRYPELFNVPQEEALRLFADIPFLNGGLFECLDKRNDAEGSKNEITEAIDCFTTEKKYQKQLRVPDILFFGSEHSEDLSINYDPKEGSKHRRDKVRGLFDLLGSYKFTVEENTPLEEEVALDPELLGRVFESLLATYNTETRQLARKQTGSFYTPREIVTYMVDESLIRHLATALVPAGQATTLAEEDRIRLLVGSQPLPSNTFTEDEARQLLQKLATSRLLDPACGSGAFPMGMLQQLVHIIQRLDPTTTHWRELLAAEASEEASAAFRQLQHDDEQRAARLQEVSEAYAQSVREDYYRKLYIIERVLYGVDLQPIAVLISKLRFFISLLAEQRPTIQELNIGIRPLPNLETKFVAADTLVTLKRPKVEAQLSISLMDSTLQKLRGELFEVRHKHFLARNRAKRALQREDLRLRELISKRLKDDTWPDAVADQVASWNPYDQNTAASFFDPEWMFDLTEGFDVVIGNPPYVQLSKMKETAERLYKPEGYSTYSKTTDLYCLFYERGLDLLRPNGLLTYITSNSWLQTQYGKTLRQLFTQESDPLVLINFADAQLFNAAVVETNILIARKSGYQHQLQATTIGPDYAAGSALAPYMQENAVLLNSISEDGWSVGKLDSSILKTKFETNGKKIELWDISIYRGITTGLNEAFIIDGQTRLELIKLDENNNQIIKPSLSGRDLQKYSYKFNDKWMIFTHNGVKSDAIPRINAQRDYSFVYEYLSAFKPGIVNRADQGAHWSNLRDCSYIKDFDKPKIVWGELSNKAKFTFDDKGHYLNNSAFMLTGQHLKYLLAVFNSEAAKWYFDKISTTSGMGTNRWLKYKIQQLPVPVPSQVLEEEIEALVNELLLLKKNIVKINLTKEEKFILEQRIDEIESQLNGLIYNAYKLSNEDVALITSGISAETSVLKVEEDLGLKKGTLKNPDGTKVGESRSLGGLYNAYHELFDVSEDSE